jgi:hypothetical protein
MKEKDVCHREISKVAFLRTISFEQYKCCRGNKNNENGFSTFVRTFVIEDEKNDFGRLGYFL